MMSCREASELISQALDRNLPWHARLAVRFHLWICKACARFEAEMGFLRSAVHRHAERLAEGDDPGAPRLGDGARARIKARLRQSGA